MSNVERVNESSLRIIKMDRGGNGSTGKCSSVKIVWILKNRQNVTIGEFDSRHEAREIAGIYYAMMTIAGRKI